MLIKSLAVVSMVPMLTLGAPATSAIVSLSTTVAGTSTSSAAGPTSTSLDPNYSCIYLNSDCEILENQVDFRSIFNKSICVAALLCQWEPDDGYLKFNIDDTIKRWWLVRHRYDTGYPTSKTLPKLSVNIFNQNSSDGKVWTQQNFIDFYYGQLSTIGRYPKSVDVVIGYWSKVAAWTGFCQTKAIPYQNLADWFTYSSNVKGAADSC